jgi:hypothetical protein
LPQQFSLICCCATPRRSKHGEWLRQISLFSLFAAVVKSLNCRFCKKHLSQLQNLQNFPQSGEKSPYSPIRFRRYFAICDRLENRFWIIFLFKFLIWRQQQQQGLIFNSELGTWHSERLSAAANDIKRYSARGKTYKIVTPTLAPVRHPVFIFHFLLFTPAYQ